MQIHRRVAEIVSLVSTDSYFQTAALITVILLSVLGTYAQHQASMSPDRGAKVGNSYALGDFETINTTNGNLMLNFPLGSLPKGRGTATAGVTLTYNSKLYNMRSERRSDYRQFDAYYSRTIIEKDLAKAGWSINSGYRLETELRFPPLTAPNCTVGPSETNDQILYSKKLRVVFPDGSAHELVPYGHKDKLGDRYFNITMEGFIDSCQNPNGSWTTRPVYYSLDGSFLRLETTTNTDWTLYFPDGSKVEDSGRVIDRNGNYVDTLNGIVDEFGRAVTITTDTNGDTLVTSKGVGDNEDVVWRIKWKTIYVLKSYTACTHHVCPADDFPLENYRDYLQESFEVVDKIFQPEQLGGRAYIFTYNGSDTATPYPFDLDDLTDGWGELSGITLPSGATVTYDYLMDGEDGPTMFENTKDILKNHVTTKTVRYALEYDGTVDDDPGAVEVWNYEVGTEGTSVTAPDESVTTTEFGTTQPDSSGGLPWTTGLTLRTTSANGSKVENLWARNTPETCSSSWGTCTQGYPVDHPDNPYVKTTFTSLKEGSSYTLTAIKDFTYDKNGNVTEVREYDYVPYSSVPRTNGYPTGLPSNASSYLKRVTKTVYFNDVPEASSTSYGDGDTYIFASSKRLLRLAKSVEIQDASQAVKSRTELTYDYTNYNSSNTKAGNPTLTRQWDSTKGSLNTPDSYGNRLDQYNSISTSATYNGYGMPLTTTDANNVVTQFTYANVTVGGNSVTGPYPTQTVAAYGTGIARTSTAVYDFHTGVVTSATDEDNDVTVVTEYDDLGRPIKVKNAYNTTLESWTQTTYHDGDANDPRQYIVVRSDIDTMGDGRKVATTFFDQLGRVRLAKALEDAATESATNETDGIKVQTRYKYTSGFTYQVQSNPYRADLSSEASTEETMGWSLSTGWSSGIRSEVQTYAGPVLPAPWGTNANSTGIVRTDIDANRTLVTDQAGKQWISKTNALGHLTDVWEITAQDSATVSVTFPSTSIAYGYQTSYSYDTLNNLLLVTQGVQERKFVYSSLSRLMSAENPESGTLAYSYDPNGNLKTKVDARNIKTIYDYDSLNRVIDRCYRVISGSIGATMCASAGSETPEPNTSDVEYTYGTTAPKVGKLTKVESSVSTTEYTSFDILGRVTASKQTTDNTDYTSSYSYNLSGAWIEQTYPSGRKVKNVLDSSGDLTLVQSKRNSSEGYWNYASSFSYNAAGAVTSMQLGNGRWESTQFNSRLQPTQIALGSTPGASNFLELDYSYGTTANNGNVMSQTINFPGLAHPFIQSYTYDQLNRIDDSSETYNGGQTWRQDFAYDRYGNRNFVEANTTTIPKTCGTSPNFTVCEAERKLFNPAIDPANNRLDADDDYAFDSSGNTTDDPQGREFIYDAENKQVKVFDGSETVGEYWYDGDGKRVRKHVPSTGEVTVFVYDASGKLIAAYSTIVAGTNDARVAYLTSDNLGSPRINTDANGTVTSRHDYHPFGEEIAASQRTTTLGYIDDTIRKQFTGYERDEETELDFAQARMYAPMIARFSCADPTLASVSGLKPQSWNRYVYVMNNPVLYTDPLGLWALKVEVRNKIDEDGNPELDKKGRNIKETIISVVKTKSSDDGARLAEQLGLKGKDAAKLAAAVGDSASVRLSGLKDGRVGGAFKEMEKQLNGQLEWERKNSDKLAELKANDIGGPDDANCSGTTAYYGLTENRPNMGPEDLDRLANNPLNATRATGDPQFLDMIRYRRGGTATHWVNFVFADDDGTQRVFSKSGNTGPYVITPARNLEGDKYGKIDGAFRGRNPRF